MEEEIGKLQTSLEERNGLLQASAAAVEKVLIMSNFYILNAFCRRSSFPCLSFVDLLLHLISFLELTHFLQIMSLDFSYILLILSLTNTSTSQPMVLYYNQIFGAQYIIAFLSWKFLERTVS